jgi:nicotinate-nucleotide pyrophosphorylase (carboxylating)
MQSPKAPSALDPTTESLIQAAIAEDVGGGDVTATYFVPEDSVARAQIVAREQGVMAGVEIAVRVFALMDARVEARALKSDGEAFVKGDVLMEISGPTRGLLTGERTALNFLQRLCGIATQTRRYVEAVKPHPVQIWDTRKTTPGWRLLEKAAVKAGGGTNHRMGLYDHVMVKDNHIAANGSSEQLQSAIDRVKAERPGVRIQIECDTLEQMARFLKLRGVDMLLLDNMGCEKLREAVQMNAGKLWLEASGGITLDMIAQVAATGVNAISVGALTHSARALDLGLDFV